MDKSQIEMAKASLLDELNGAYLYDALAKAEKNEKMSEIYHRMAEVERRHAANWSAKLNAAGIVPPKFAPNFRTRSLSWLATKLGVGAVLPTITSMEQRDSNKYAGVEGAEQMSYDEHHHSILLQQAAKSAKGGLEGGMLARLEGRHKASGGNALRAAVLGANDGLVSNLSLVMGVAGAEFQSNTILITGLAGLLAGAISMALGEWLSVQSARELYSHQISIEAAEIEAAPEEEAEELALIYEARGIPKEQAKEMAMKVISDPTIALDTLAREELNVDTEELGGSAWEAALTSFFLFAVGAVIPVIGFTFLQGLTAIIVSIVLSAIGLFVIGAAITIFTGRNVIYSGIRQVTFGLIAAAVTFGIGRLVGVSLAG